MKKAQVSIEVMTVVGLMFLTFLLLLGISLQTGLDILQTKRIIEGRTECIKLANFITEAYVYDDGLNLSKRLGLNASIEPSSRLVSVKNRENIFCTIPLSNITNASLSAGSIRVRNNNGVVTVENA